MRTGTYAASLGLLIMVGFFDYSTGYDFLVHLFYLGPVAIAAWRGGRRPAWVLTTLSALVWLLVDHALEHPYPSPLYRYWNLLMFFGTLAVLGQLLARLREALETAQRMLQAKEAALRELDESTRRLRQLEGSFQSVCAWTNQIKDGDEWIDFQEFLRRRLHIKLTHGMSPEGAKKFLGEFSPPQKPIPPDATPARDGPPPPQEAD